ncbi:MAG: aldolase [Alphaproteobacteria bacterium]|nr:aldolase [Alphaproteobacteria bacterium]
MSATDPVQQARIDLAAALRWAARHQLNEGIDNHFSMVVPGREDCFLINPNGLHWSEITPADLVMTDASGTVIEGRHPVEATAFYIHGRVHRGNPNAKVVLHTHMPYATALSTLAGGRVEMCTQNAFRYYDRIAYDEQYNGLALDNEEGDRLCRAMGDKSVLVLRNHGVVVAGPSVAVAYDDLYFLERTALVQVLAMQTGRPLEIVPTQVVARTARQIADGCQQQAVLHFEALKRMLSRDEPGWDRLD